jgi:MFS family permease
MFLVSLAVFIVASALGGLANDGLLLIATRFVKGVSAAFTAPAGLSIITTSFAEGPARNKAISVYTATGAAGFSLGLVFSGLLTQVGWRWVFFLPVVVALVTLAAAVRLVPDTGRPERRSTRLAPLVSRFGVTRLILVGLGSTVVAYALFLPVGLDSSYPRAMLPTFLLAGLGFALAYGPLNIAATNGIAAEEQGLAGGLLNTSFQFGGALVLAVVTAVNNANAGPGGTPQAVLDGFHAAWVVSLVAAILGAGTMALGLRSPAPIPSPAPSPPPRSRPRSPPRPRWARSPPPAPPPAPHRRSGEAIDRQLSPRRSGHRFQWPVLSRLL